MIAPHRPNVQPFQVLSLKEEAHHQVSLSVSRVSFILRVNVVSRCHDEVEISGGLVADIGVYRIEVQIWLGHVLSPPEVSNEQEVKAGGER